VTGNILLVGAFLVMTFGPWLLYTSELAWKFRGRMVQGGLYESQRGGIVYRCRAVGVTTWPAWSAALTIEDHPDPTMIGAECEYGYMEVMWFNLDTHRRPHAPPEIAALLNRAGGGQ